MESIKLDYYYGSEENHIAFYRIPKLLLHDERYNTISLEAKVLYGLMIDRMEVSYKNKNIFLNSPSLKITLS